MQLASHKTIRLWLVLLGVTGICFVLFASPPKPRVTPFHTKAFKQFLTLLSWDYPAYKPCEVEFYVYHSYDLSIPMSQWEVLDTTFSTYYPIMVQNTNEYFAVRAFDCVNNVFSDWATTSHP